MQRLNVDQVAERLACSPRQVRKLIEAGQLKGINISVDPNGKYKKFVVDVADLEAFENGRFSQPPVKKPRRAKARNYKRYV